MIIISPVNPLNPLGQILPAQPYLPAVPNYICTPDRSISTMFSYKHADGRSLHLWLPGVIHDLILRENVEKGMSVYDAYVASGVGADKAPGMAMRPCIRSALLTKGYGMTIAKTTCDQYWHCFQEYIRGYQKYPVADALGRRMEIAPGVFAPGKTEETCIRDTYMKLRSLRDAYNYCGCAEIYPALPGAAEFIAGKIAEKPRFNLYWAIKEHYILYRTGEPVPTVVPTPIPVEPTPAPEPTPGPEPEPTTFIPVTLPPEEEEKAGISWLPLVLGGVVVFALMSGGEES